MAEDWAADVKKYVPDADDAAIAGIVRYCGIALQKRDSSLVAFGDVTETDRIRAGFLRRKLALTQSDEELDAAIAAVGERMKGDTTKNRVTVYYLLAEHFGDLGLFLKGSVRPAEAAPVAPAPVEPAPAEVAAPPPEPVAEPAPAALLGEPAPAAATKPARSRWLTWVLLALLLFVLWWLFIRTPTLPDDVVAVDVQAVDDAK